MNHERDYDRDRDREDVLSKRSLSDILNQTLEMEEELMRTYMITAERVHDNEDLKVRLRNFAEGNAKRTRQLIDELEDLQ